MATISPDTDRLIELFNPRIHPWDEHFAMVGAEILGISEIGRATVQLLDMNEEERVIIRAQLQSEGML